MGTQRIGLIFSYNEQWIGGTYYILNLVHALNLLEENQKPELIIFSNAKDFKLLKNETNYPYLSFERMDENPTSKVLRFVNKLSGKLFKKKLFKRRFNQNIDIIFPYQKNNYLANIPKEKHLYWIPDFQEKHLPHFFPEQELQKREKNNQFVTQESKKLLLSSKDVLTDLKQFYPTYKTTPYVVHFAVQHPDISELNIFELLRKHQLPETYFFAPNQFWKHKNQMLIIQAAELLKKQGTEIIVAFSGKESDARNPEYTEGLKQYVKQNNLGQNIRFLGFLDRKEQLKLMQNSIAVIQPSLFEGWSTVIEDAMALKKVVLAADLNVNKEQLQEKGFYFGRKNPQELVQVIKNIYQTKPHVTYNYLQKQQQFAKDFMECLK